MNYIGFLKKINELTNNNWKARITDDRSHFVLLQNEDNIALSYDKVGSDSSYHLFNLGGVNSTALDLIYAFIQSKEPLQTDEEEENYAKWFGLVKNYPNKQAVAMSIMTDRLESMIEEHHAN